jgi:hypothetical protein
VRFGLLQQLRPSRGINALALALCLGASLPIAIPAAWAQQATDTPYTDEQPGDILRQGSPIEDQPLSAPAPLYAPMIEEEIEKPPSGAVGILRAVDKITARVTDIEAPLDQAVPFGTLQITMRYCYKNPPEDTPEVTAFLEVEDHQPDRQPAKTFTGWMFASSPALSAMEHPVYDVWVIDCKAAPPEISDGKALKSP